MVNHASDWGSNPVCTIFVFLFHSVYPVRDTVRVGIVGVRGSILGCVAVLTVP